MGFNASCANPAIFFIVSFMINNVGEIRFSGNYLFTVLSRDFDWLYALDGLIVSV